MERFAILAPPFPSHIRALQALASRLIDSGHSVVWVHQAEVQKFLDDDRVRFCAVGALSHPKGSLDRMLRRAANPGSLHGLRRVIADIAANTEMLCREGPSVLKNFGITVVIADQMEAAGGLLAAGLQLPYISVACALPVNREAAVPLAVMPWAFATSNRGLELNKNSARVYDWLMRPHGRVIAKFSKSFGLPLKQTLEDCLSPLAQLSQTTADFDFPRSRMPAHFHHVGPMRDTSKPAGILACTVNPLRPFVFASFGTLQGGRFSVFMRIARACKALKFQLLIAHCGLLETRHERFLRKAGATWVTGFVNQEAAVKVADVVVTHGGLNTVLDALSAGTPVLVMPIAFDQPGVAARIIHAKVGLKLSPRWATETSICTALSRLVEEPVFAQNAQRLGKGVALAGGTDEAARVVLSAIARSPCAKISTSQGVDVCFDEGHAYAT